MILRELQVYGGDGPFLVFFEKKTTKPTGGQLCKRVRRILKNSALQRHSQVTSKVTAALLFFSPLFFKANKQKKTPRKTLKVSAMDVERNNLVEYFVSR
jgi:hypothetical protein